MSKAFTDECAGLEGTAEPAVPLDEFPAASEQAPPVDITGEETRMKSQDPIDVVAQLGETTAAAEGLSLLMKLGLAGLILAACYGFVKANSPRRTAHAGRHGAYPEKILA